MQATNTGTTTASPTTAFIGVTVFKRTSGTSETNIVGSATVPAAQASSSSTTFALILSIQSIPTTTLATTDSIVVRVYTKTNEAASWSLLRTFTTPQLGLTQIGGIDWRFQYFFRLNATTNGGTQFRTMAADPNKSRIECFTQACTIPPGPPPAPNGTRYFDQPKVSVNGLTAYNLTTNPVGPQSTTTGATTVTPTSAIVGITVAQRTVFGTENIFLGSATTPIAQATTTLTSFSLKSVAVTIPLTTLSVTDSIVIRVYGKTNQTSIFTLMRTFTTPQLGRTSIGGYDWTVRYFFRLNSTTNGAPQFRIATVDPNKSRIDCFFGGTCPVSDTFNISPPPPGGFIFAFAGDLGYKNDTIATIQRLSKSSVPISFFFLVGDIAYGEPPPVGTVEQTWCARMKNGYTSDYSGAGGPSWVGFNNMNILIGNHETINQGNIYNFITYCPATGITVPSTAGNEYGIQYYFDYPTVNPLLRIIGTCANMGLPAPNNTGCGQYTVGSARYNWLSDTIDNARNIGIRWIVVANHVVCITAGQKNCEIAPNGATSSDFLNLLTSKHVDLLIHGHEHSYMRSKQLTNGITVCGGGVGCSKSFNATSVVDTGVDDAYDKERGLVIVTDGTGGRNRDSIFTNAVEANYFVKLMGGNSSGYAWNGTVWNTAGTGNLGGFTAVTVGSAQLSAITNFCTLGNTNTNGTCGDVGDFIDSFVISTQPQELVSVKQWGTVYYPWYGTSGDSPAWRHWNENGHSPPTNWAAMYSPDFDRDMLFESELYSSTNTTVIDNQITLMNDTAKFNFALVSWWGQGSYEDINLRTMLNRITSLSKTIKLAVYYELESTGDPTVNTIVTDLTYIYNNRANSSAYYRINGFPVVFVFASGSDALGMTSRWSNARQIMANSGKQMFIGLKVWSSYTTYATMVDSWHQYGPTSRSDTQAGYSITISPGYWEYPELAISRGHCSSPCTNGFVGLARDDGAFNSAIISANSASNIQFVIIISFNEWHEGTQIEPGFVAFHNHSGFSQGGDYFGLYEIYIIGARGGIPTATPSSNPTSLVVVTNPSNVTITWNTPVSNGGSAITHYILYRNNVFFQYLGVVNSYVDTTVGSQIFPTARYSYFVKAVNLPGTSSASNSGSSSTTPLSGFVFPFALFLPLFGVLIGTVLTFGYVWWKRSTGGSILDLPEGTFVIPGGIEMSTYVMIAIVGIIVIIVAVFIFASIT